MFNYAFNKKVMTVNKQSTNTIMMIRPFAFNYNVQTAVNNHYQKVVEPNNSSDQINLKAQSEFDNLVLKLRSIGVNIIVFQDDNKFDTPDSLFPNNWVSFHSNGDLALYPMYAEIIIIIIKYLYHSYKAYNPKNNGSLFSPTLKVDANKVSLFPH